MSTIINADTSGGLKLTSDTSGLISFQSAGVEKAGVNATGLTGDASQLTAVPAANITGTLPAIDGSALTGISSGGMTLLTTLATTSGTTATTSTLDLTGYLQLVIWIYSVYPATGSSALRMGENGGTQLIIRDLVTSAAEPAYMQLNHNLSSGVYVTLENGYGMGVSDTSLARQAGATGIGINTAIDTATTALTFDLAGGQTFTGGSIKVYGLK